LCSRLNNIISGDITQVDTVLLLTWAGLVLLPLVSEVDILGIKLKNQINQVDNKVTKVENQLTKEILTLRTEIVSINQANANTTFNQSFNFGALSDEEIKNKYGNHKKISEINTHSKLPEVPNRIIDLFTVRYNLEKEIKRILVDEGEEVSSKTALSGLTLYVLFQHHSKLNRLMIFEQLLDVISICNAAVYGASAQVSETQYNFVMSNASMLIHLLKRID